jgi:uncharacterized membrane protein
MTHKKALQCSLLAGAVALAVGAYSNNANAATDKEKCYGVVKAGHNDCGNADKTHSCMGQAETDGDGGEWIAMPAGLCERLVGGSLEPIEDEDAEAEQTTEEKNEG